MSALLSQLEGRERRAECLRNDAALNGDCWMVIHHVYRNPLREFWTVRRKAETLLNDKGAAKRFRSDSTAQVACSKANAAFFAECEAEARDVMRNRSEK